MDMTWCVCYLFQRQPRPEERMRCPFSTGQSGEGCGFEFAAVMWNLERHVKRVHMWVMAPVSCFFESRLRVRSATPVERLEIIRVIKEENRHASCRYVRRQAWSFDTEQLGLMPAFQSQNWRGNRHGRENSDRQDSEYRYGV